MSRLLFRYHRFSVTFLLFLLLPAAASARTQTFKGKAYNEGGALVYKEQHTVRYNGDEVVRSRTAYFDPDDRPIGSLVSEYEPSPRFNDYTFEDRRKQYVDGVRLEGGSICLFRREAPGEPEETECLGRDDAQIVGQGFHHFIVEHLEAVAAGEVFHVKLALPSRLDQFDFRIRKLRSEGGRLWIRLEVDHWLLRLFAPHIDVLYDRPTGHLLRYYGISNVADASGECVPVRIEYVH